MSKPGMTEERIKELREFCRAHPVNHDTYVQLRETLPEALNVIEALEQEKQILIEHANEAYKERDKLRANLAVAVEALEKLKKAEDFFLEAGAVPGAYALVATEALAELKKKIKALAKESE